MIGYLKHYKKDTGPYIIIVPKSTLQNWKNEFSKWCPSLKTVTLIGSQEERDRTIDEVIKPRDFEVFF